MFINQRDLICLATPGCSPGQVEELHRNGPWRTDFLGWPTYPLDCSTGFPPQLCWRFAKDFQKHEAKPLQSSWGYDERCFVDQHLCCRFWDCKNGCMYVFLCIGCFKGRAIEIGAVAYFSCTLHHGCLHLEKSCNARNSQKPDTLAAYHFLGRKSQIYITIHNNYYLNFDICLHQHFRGIWTARQWWKHQVMTFFLAQLTLSEESDADRMRIRWSSTSRITFSYIIYWFDLIHLFWEFQKLFHFDWIIFHYIYISSRLFNNMFPFYTVYMVHLPFSSAAFITWSMASSSVSFVKHDGIPCWRYSAGAQTCQPTELTVGWWLRNMFKIIAQNLILSLMKTTISIVVEKNGQWRWLMLWKGLSIL